MTDIQHSVTTTGERPHVSLTGGVVGGNVTWLLEMRMPLLVISSSLCVSKLVRASSPEEKIKRVNKRQGGTMRPYDRE